jgi:hypothetical protein
MAKVTLQGMQAAAFVLIAGESGAVKVQGAAVYEFIADINASKEVWKAMAYYVNIANRRSV